MAYSPQTDFLALLRETSGGMRTERMPGLDYIVSAMARAGMFTLAVSQTAPTSNQSTTVWLQPQSQSWTGEGVVWLWNATAGAYEPATALLWQALFASQVVQEVTGAGPVNVLANAGIVRVNQTIAAPITLIMPASTVKIGDVLISDWKGDAGTNNITVQTSGTDKLPGNRTTWTIAGDGGSLCLRPLPGGYVL